MKQLSHAGLRPELCFYRDTHGNEVDLLIRQGRQWIPVEIKSASTFSLDFLKGIHRFRAVAGEERVAEGFVLFNGENSLQVQGVRVLNPLRDTQAWLARCEGLV